MVDRGAVTVGSSACTRLTSEVDSETGLICDATEISGSGSPSSEGLRLSLAELA